MTSVTIVTEDTLSTALLTRLVAEADIGVKVGMRLPKESRRKSPRGNTYIESRIGGFNHAARYQPYMVLLDLDDRECAPGYVRQLLPHGASTYMLLRIAVREAESWVLADREGFHAFSGVAKEKIPADPDTLPDPKQTLINLVRASRKRRLREAIVPTSAAARIGPDYNATLTRMLAEHWKLDRAIQRSPCLASAFSAIRMFSHP